ncbi:hypothetical protein [Janibacter hoylei]|uniref:hypothetical protein n=1 Tax=Janibacter hoylei TaxID=364298 RepID=UPI002490F44F|nr:hypothetical protein [Janibacter hoylei]
MGHPAPDHSAEITALQRYATSDLLSPLEVKAVLTAIEVLEAHEKGRVEVCDLPHVLSLVSLCLGRAFEPVPATS